MKTINIKLWFAFFLVVLIPALQNLVRLHFIGDMPNEWGFNIASQIQWLGILYEILKEGFLIPLFYMLFLAYNENNKDIENKAISGLSIVFIVHLLLSFFIFFFTEEFLNLVNIEPQILDETISYIRLESFAIVFSISSEYLLIYLATLGRVRDIVWFSFIKSILLILSDILLLSDGRYSLNLGVNGIAISNLIINITLSIYILFKTRILHYISFKNIWKNINWLKFWFKLGAFSGLESFVRNIVFFIMILGMMNKIGEQGTFWITNSVIWGILLAPSMALAEIVKRDVASNYRNIISNTRYYFLATIFFSILWVISIPAWDWFLPNVLKIDNPLVIHLMTIQTGFYIVFMFNNSVLDATLTGLGLTKYILYQSIIVNVGYYGIIYILHNLGHIEMSLDNIAYIFGGGMLVDMIPTIFLYLKAIKERSITLNQIFFGK